MSAPTAYEWLNDAVKRLLAEEERLRARVERAGVVVAAARAFIEHPADRALLERLEDAVDDFDDSTAALSLPSNEGDNHG